jgi:outer membrane protein TolC
MADTPSPDALAAEFDCLMARAGIKIAPQRRAAVLAAYADLRAQIALLHGRYGPEAEPSNVFRLGAAGGK